MARRGWPANEATFAALRLARVFTGHDKVLKFEGGWHGGHVFDLTGGYTHSYAHAVLSGLVNLAIVGALWRRVSRARARIAAPVAAGQLP